jgi:hypothetical protein
VRTLAGIAFTAALFWLAMAIAVGLANVLAHADPLDTPGLVCQQSALGQSPSEIADELKRGNPTLPLPGMAVWSAIGSCP